jgi:TonB family protein
MSKRAVTHWLIHHAALNAPASLSQRLEEEWLADLAARPSAMSRLRFAIGCCWATRVIARELGASPVAATASIAGDKLIVAPFDSSGFLSRRSITLLFVVGIHVVVFYGLMTGLTPTFLKVITSPLQTRTLPQPRARDLPPLPPHPQITMPKIEVPTPEFHTWRDNDENVIASQPPSNPAMPPAPPPHEVNRVQGGPGTGFPTTDDYYPSAAKRMEEQGATTVRVCVDPNGRLTSDPATVQTSGSARLDQGALQLAKAGSGHYRATTEDGRPVNSCYSFRVRFELRN